MQDPAFWTGVALVLFVIALTFAKVPNLLGKSLDGRAISIKNELDEAKRLREEAQSLLDTQKRKAAQAQKESEAIIAEARAETRRAGDEARVDLKAQIERRRAQAEDKIARAEEQATQDIRTYAASISVGAARRFIKSQLDDTRAAQLVDGAIATLPQNIRGK
jgi:F-type H+-transporting ATPase subunit b